MQPSRSRRGLLAAALAVALLPPAQAADKALATVAAEMREVGLSHATDATVEAIRLTTLAAQVPGRIVELRANAGDTVAKGQVLARIDEREALEAVAASQAQAARTQAELGNASVNLERARKLVAQNFMSKAALDKAQADYDSARAQLAAARASAAQAQTVQGHTLITAPYAGVVGERLVEVGDMAQPGKPLLSVFDPRDLRAIAYVPQDKVAEIRAGGVSVELPGLAQRVTAERVTVLPSADPRTHTTLVRADLPGGLKGVYPGQFARVHFTAGSARKLVIPASSVVHRSEVAGAYVVAGNGAVSLRQLRLGQAAGENGVEVLAGIVAGEKVALDPIAALATLKKAPVK